MILLNNPICRFIVATVRRFQAADAVGASAAMAFSILLALVPLVTVVMSMLTSSPMFRELGESLQQFAYQQLVPSAAGSVEQYVDEFVGKAGRLTQLGSVLLFVTSLNLLYTMERYLNRIFGNGDRRGMTMRLVVYWAMITLMPLLFGMSISLTSYALAQAQALVGGEQIGVFLRRLAPVLLVGVGFSVLFASLPNRSIKFSSAALGGLVSALLFELAKSIFALWAGKAVGYQAIYGAMAILPLFLVWLWACSLVTFIGACVAAQWESQSATQPKTDTEQPSQS